MAQASDEHIENFLAFTDTVDRETASLFIRGNSNNIEAAVGAYYDNPDPSRYADQNRWDDTAWQADRAGINTENSVIPYDDSLVPYGPMAPSRPPSPSKKGADFPEIGPMLPPQGHPDIWEGEAEAMRQSQMEQETGMLDASGREYVPDVSLEAQKRRSDAPAFIKPLPNQELLSSLITILYTIPGFRAHMYNNFDVLSDYGQNEDWWKGEDIEQVRIIDNGETAGEKSNESSAMNVIYEIQRLMAFLDKTDRAYGSIASLAKSPYLLELAERKEWSQKITISSFVESLDDIAVQLSKNEASTMFKCTAIEELEGEADREKSVSCFELNLHQLPKYIKDFSLDGILEELFWSENRWITQIGPVVLFRVQQTLPLTNITIPNELFFDRYHIDNAQVVQEMRKEMAAVDDIQMDVRKRLKRLNTLRSTKGNLEALKILDTAVDFLQKGQNEPSEDDNIPSTALTGQAQILLNQLEKVQSHIQSLLESAQKEQDALEARFKEIRSRLTEPTAEGGYAPKQRYTLQGVAISPNDKRTATYIKHPQPFAVNSMRQPSEVIGTQWWKLTYDFSKTPAIVRTDKTEEHVVLNTTNNNRGESLLVYASDAMLEGHETAGIPEPLQRFVEADNRALQAETAADIAISTEMVVDEDEDTLNVSPIVGSTPQHDSDMDIDHTFVPVIEGTEPVYNPTNIGSNETPEKAQEMEELKQTSSSMSLARESANGVDGESHTQSNPAHQRDSGG